MATSKEMTAGPALPLILRFTLPLLLGNLLQQTYSLVDAAIVGKFLGINSLASVGASTSVVFLILGFCNGCCGGFGIPVAQKFGARDYSTMRSYVSVSLKLSMVMSVAIAVVTSILCADILRMMRTPENIFEGAYAYLLVTFIGVPFTFFYNLLSSIIRALGDSKTPFWFLLLSTVLNIILDLFCILVLGWGVAGAAIATVFSQGLSAVLCYIYMYRKFEILRSTPKERRFQPKLAKTLLYRCADGTSVLHHRYWQYHAAKCEQCVGNSLCCRLYLGNAHQDVLYLYVRESGDCDGYLQRTELWRGQTGTYLAGY